MISLGSKAPEFALPDHFGRKIASADFIGKRHLLLLFYPLDFTPT
jgi:peroxiredoxin